MLATPALSGVPSFRGVRPVDLRRDGRQVFALLDAAFGPLIDPGGRRLILSSSDFHSNRMGQPLSRRRRKLQPSGFVWEEHGRLLGTLSIMGSTVANRYLIANVAIHVDHRRRGLARALMAEALNHLTEIGGREVLLQVKEDNMAALALYRSLGFQILGSMIQWESSTSRMRLPDLRRPASITIDRLPADGWRMAFDVDREAVKPELNWPAPPRPDKYRRGFWRRLSDTLNGRREETWVARPDPNSGKWIGLLTLIQEWAMPYRLELRVSRDWREEATESLLYHGISRLTGARGNTIRIDHPAADAFAGRVLEEANFRSRRVLAVMRREMV